MGKDRATRTLPSPNQAQGAREEGLWAAARCTCQQRLFPAEAGVWFQSSRVQWKKKSFCINTKPAIILHEEGGEGEGEGVATQQKRGGGREGGAGEREEAMGVPVDVEVTPTAADWTIRIRQEVGRHARLDPSQSTSTGPYKLRRKQCRARPQPSQRVDVVALRWNTAWMV